MSETAKIIDSLRASPLLMGLMVINVLFLGIFWWALTESNERRHVELQHILDRCLPQQRS